MHKKIAFSPPDITDLEIAEVVDTLRSGWITTGPKAKLFEQKISEFSGTSRAAVLNSATAGLELVLRLLGIGEGDEVITTAYTYSASASVICHVGATVVFVDTAKDSFHIDFEKIQTAITPRTKAVMAVDVAGVMCDYDQLIQIAESEKGQFQPGNPLQAQMGRIAVIADAAHSFGASYKGVKSGNAADFTVFSFHAVKNLTTAEGGAVTWKKADFIEDDEVYKRFMLLSLHGQSKDALSKDRAGGWEYDILLPGYKYNMTDITASLGLAQLSRYDQISRRRAELVRLYNRGLDHCGFSVLEHFTPVYQSSAHLYLVRLLDKTEHQRNDVIQKLAQRGIAANVHYKPLPMHTAYKNLGFSIDDFPESYAVYQNVITLPLHTLLTDEDVDYVCETLKEVL